MTDWLILLGAALFAGFLNAIAGGGSFITFPALVFVGISPVAANATSAVAVFPGYLGAVAGFRDEVKLFERKLLYRYLVATGIGGFVGSLLLLISSNAVFSFIVPWLLLFATVMFGCSDLVLKRFKEINVNHSSVDIVLLFLVSIYGGYFNGGLGIILLAALLVVGLTDLNLMNGLKNGISFCISIVSVVTFTVAGLVHWQEAVVMMLATTLGGYYGATWAKKIPQAFLKYLITAIGFIMTIVFFYRS